MLEEKMNAFLEPVEEFVNNKYSDSEKKDYLNLFNSIILDTKRTLENIAEEKSSKQNIDQKKRHLIKNIEKQNFLINNANLKINDLDLLGNKEIALVDTKILKKETVHFFNTFENYYIDFNTGIVLKKLRKKGSKEKLDKPFIELKERITNHFKKNHPYTKDNCENLIKDELNCSDNRIIEKLINILFKKKGETYYIDIDNELEFSECFKEIYPNGVELPQEKDSKLGGKNLEFILKELPERKDKNNKYRHVLQHYVLKNKNIIDYKKGRYIHVDYIKKLYKENKDFIDLVYDEVFKLLEKYKKIKTLDLWQKMNINKSKFITMHILQHLLEYSDKEGLKLYREHTNYEKKGQPTFAIKLETIGEDKPFANSFLKKDFVDLNNLINNDKYNLIDSINFYLDGREQPRRLKNRLETKLEKEIKDIENLIANLPEIEREQIVKTRVGQGLFREILLQSDKNCKICRLEKQELLRASHIRPWRACEEGQHLNQYNGFLLCPNHDALFDKGYISFNDDGSIKISELLSHKELELFGLIELKSIELKPQNLKFLKWHRDNLFKQ